jgi:methionine-rich copper-binding protein CopC
VKLARLAACILMTLPAWPAQAHVHLHESTPADGSTLQAAPSRLQLVFSEAARLTALSIRATGETAPHKLAPPAQTAASFTIDLPPLAPGSYRIEWRALSPDHHIASGTVSFAVQATPGKP